MFGLFQFHGNLEWNSELYITNALDKTLGGQGTWGVWDSCSGYMCHYTVYGQWHTHTVDYRRRDDDDVASMI